MSGGSRTGLGSRSLLSYFDAFAPTPDWDDVVWWPPDVFAVANLLLDHTECYRFVVAPPPGRSWPPLPDWAARVRAEADAWRRACSARGCAPPPLVRDCWSTVTHHRDVPLATLHAGEAWEATAALLTLHALADEACADVAACRRRELDAPFEVRAWTMLEAHGSLSRLSPARVRIVPKSRFSERGITIRSLSRHLALCYESVEVTWRSIEPGPAAERDEYNLVLVPWPLSLEARDFRPVPTHVLRNMDTTRYAFFEFRPQPSPGPELVGSLLEEAACLGAAADAVVFPEAALEPGAIDALERSLADHGATFLIAGVAEPPSHSGFGRNYLHFGVRTGGGWDHHRQDKHHRWCLDEGQIRQYHLTRSLDPRRLWWEAIDVRERTLHIVDVGSGITTAPLVCEDLARLDEVADLVRRIGPGLVVALLLDGPQLHTRWPSRYASVIADDPGSAVLTLTSFGMVARARPPGSRRSRVVAHWNDRAGGARELELAPGAAAVLLTTSVEHSTVWTADGRRHDDVPTLRLSRVEQLHATRGARRPAALAGARAR